MTKIKVLDELTISKIAAGEVIERPSSIVKELVENSLDAGATQLVVETYEAGKLLIRVTDNGSGMSMEDLLIAFDRHTTSKLETVDDLQNINTLGFRGEALSSIAAVSRVEVMTRAGFNNSGLQAVVENGVVSDIVSAGTPVGTTMIVRNLFKDVPVRLKFLKSNSSEDGSIGDILLKLAIGNPSVSFKYIRDNKIVFTTAGKGDVLNNIFQLLGKEVATGLIPIEIMAEDLKVHGYISNNNLYRGNRNHQYMFVNGRYVVDYRLSRLIESQYSTMIPINRYPVFILFIEMTPAQMDVNIHPTKQEIRFSQESSIYSAVENGFKDYFKELLRVPEVREREPVKREEAVPSLWDLSRETTIEWTEKSLIPEETDRVDLVVKDFTKQEYQAETIDDFNFTHLRPAGIIFNTYILAEDSLGQSMCLIDQHAAHERIMYERLKKDYANESIAVQQLLEPLVVELSPGDYRMAMGALDHFNALGFDVDTFGNNSVAIRGIPVVFGEPDGKRLFLDILDGLSEGMSSSYDMRLDKIMKLACTSAVKGGDALDLREVRALFEQLDNCENPLTCPHGRPTIIKMTRRELEKKFLRIV
ncbi:MAG: DNA mismatch repair endonuclease MutL [Gudongella sp.]|nr:DNA mismatch repair endonuclease MutL [Gudongella sp.]